jgi:hypothetical protein
MRISEAAYIGARLQEIPVEQLSPVLNLGSSNEDFRTHTHPHVDREIFFPLVARGAHVIHADLKADRGIDIVGDIYDAAFQAECRQLRPKTVVCCNILEHVTDPASFARIVSALVPIDGYVVVSVPHSYPFHADPIDTLFRPSPSEIVDLFGSELSPVVTHKLTDITWLSDLRTRMPASALPLFFLKDLVKAAIELPSAQKRFKRLHRYLWLTRPFQMSIVILRRHCAVAPEYSTV